jgi:hypothetical protein
LQSAIGHLTGSKNYAAIPVRRTAFRPARQKLRPDVDHDRSDWNFGEVSAHAVDDRIPQASGPQALFLL